MGTELPIRAIARETGSRK